MAQKDLSPPARFMSELRDVLDEPFGLVLPEAVVETAGRRAFAASLTPTEAAIRIVHEHARLVSQHLVDEDATASDLNELIIATRIDDAAGLAKAMDRDILDLLPDLGDFVRQPCFSDEFREMVANIATWHGIPEHRWNAPDGQALGLRVASA